MTFITIKENVFIEKSFALNLGVKRAKFYSKMSLQFSPCSTCQALLSLLSKKRAACLETQLNKSIHCEIYSLADQAVGQGLPWPVLEPLS